MNNATNLLEIPILYSVTITHQATELIHRLKGIIKTANLPLNIQSKSIDQKLTQKVRKALGNSFDQPVFIIDEKLKLSLFTHEISVAPEWRGLQRRVVTAGRKSELLLQACKLTDTSNVIDATAGFGHDSLIIASTGAQVTMIERDPRMALLLLYEKDQMSQLINWSKLMGRLNIVYSDAVQFMTNNVISSDNVDSDLDVIYLDPMFPEQSYENTTTGKGAKVGKRMQALHHIALPPDTVEELSLLKVAHDILKLDGRVVVKRPVNAPNFANIKADESWHNDVVRYDAYFKTNNKKQV